MPGEVVEEKPPPEPQPLFSYSDINSETPKHQVVSAMSVEVISAGEHVFV